jgi:hypothetical protein
MDAGSKERKEEPEFLFRGRPIKIGDILFFNRKGLGKVESAYTNKYDKYPIICFASSFTRDGFFVEEDVFPSLVWPDEVRDLLSLFSQNIKIKIKRSKTVYLNKYTTGIFAHDTPGQAVDAAKKEDMLVIAEPYTYEWEEEVNI